MNSVNGNKVRKAAAEFLLIVTGVLAALTVDAWWQGRLDDEREHQYLQQIEADVRSNSQRLQEALELEQDQLQRAQSMLAALRGTIPISGDSASAWMMRDPPFPWYSDPRVLDGTMVALIETGDINLIRDPVVRSGLIEYLGQLQADFAEFKRGIVPFLAHVDELYRMMEIARSARPQANGDDLAGSLQALARDPEAAAILRLLVTNIENRVWYLNQMREATGEIGTLLNRRGSPSR
jgi:hypothetical protein